MRKLLIASLLAGIVAGVPTAVLAVSGTSTSSGTSSSVLDLQAAKWTSTSGSTWNSTFRTIPKLSGLNICALKQVTAALSVQVSGAPATFRVLIDDGPTMPPGAIRFVPAGLHDSFSFDFVANVGPFENNDHHVFDVQWRSPTGKRILLERGTFNLQYQKGKHSC
jgi:hypothetical protein